MARYAKFFSVGAGGGGTNNLQLPVGTILDATLRQVQDGLGTGSPLYLSTRRVGITSDSSVTTQTSSVIQATTTNANLVIAPNGTGALVADIPDGTATGGNARGIYAIDLQSLRTLNTQVASGQNSVAIGINNTSSGTSSVVLGGSNSASGAFSTIGGGTGNSVNNQWDVISGGRDNVANTGNGYASIGGGVANLVTSTYGTVSGGQTNTASTGTHATVVGGQSNVSSGQYAVSGGFTNTASGQYSVAIGANNIASGSQSVSIGRNNNCSGSNSQAYGFGNTITSASAMAFGANHTVDANFATALGNSATASGEYSISMGIGCKTQNFATVAMGLNSLAYLYSQISNSSGTFTGFPAQRGDAQQSLLTARRSAVLTTGGTTVLSLDGTGTTNLIVPEGNNRLWAVKVVATAFVSVAGGTLVLGDSYMGEFTLLFKRVGGTSSVVGVNAGNIIYDTNMATAAFTFAAGASQDLQITFKAPTTASATTFRCVAKVELVEVAY
jgi:hypothetical protein